jgi:hypothetical protein
MATINLDITNFDTRYNSVKITERIFLPTNVLWICVLSVLSVWIVFG